MPLPVSSFIKRRVKKKLSSGLQKWKNRGKNLKSINAQ
jgi:hypothetical protein